jgi:RNA polymerase sigma-70 factor (ECF subfamily)
VHGVVLVTTTGIARTGVRIAKMTVSASGRAAFVDALPTELRDAFAQRDDLGAELEQLCHDAIAAWPTVTVAPAHFLAFMGARVTTPDALARLFAVDLYLVCAWLAGDTAAHEALEAGPFREAAHFLQRFKAPAEMIAEAQQRARSRLSARHDGTSALAGYTGRGPLRAWLSIMLSRELLQLIRTDRRFERLDTGELMGIVDQAGDPETVYFKTLYGEHFRRAFGDALRELDAGDRRLLRYSIVERLTIDDVGLLAGVHRATASRRIAAARERLLEAARQYMKERLRVDTGELQSILRLCESELDVSVARLLQESAA